MTAPSHPSPLDATVGLVPALRASLQAKLQRLLARPLIARIDRPTADAATMPAPSFLAAVRATVQRPAQVAPRDAWVVPPDGAGCDVAIAIDYEDRWRDQERQVLDVFKSAVEELVVWLTAEQHALLTRSPREFLELTPRPETSELCDYAALPSGGRDRVVSIRIAEAPRSRGTITHVAIIPNLVPLQRQLDALRVLEAQADDGPMAPLRALVGLNDAAALHAGAPLPGPRLTGATQLDEFQRACVVAACTTPHFAVVQGPPGSGKTTVIRMIVREALARGERVLVVSPTHVAVDNVIERLVGDAQKPLAPESLPVRYAARATKLSATAKQWWVGPRGQVRAATIARRIEADVTASLPIAKALFARVDAAAQGIAPLSSAVARRAPVICGTPLGVLSYEPVGAASVGAFDLLVVDEVSKMTLPEFLAIAVKARRWVLVGDPEQLPPFNDAEDNAVTLDDVLPSELALVCSTAALVAGARGDRRRRLRALVVANEPHRVLTVLTRQLAVVAPDVTATRFDGASARGVVVCSVAQAHDALAALLRTPNRPVDGDEPVRVLTERGLAIPRPATGSGAVLVSPRYEAAALLFEKTFAAYHTLPWARRAGAPLDTIARVDALLPAEGAHLAWRLVGGRAGLTREVLIEHLALRVAVNTVSVYDWLRGMPCDRDAPSLLREMVRLNRPSVIDAVRPYACVLRKQYRMHPSLSAVPRAMFYFEEALHDGGRASDRAPRVELVQVNPRGPDEEQNAAEADEVCRILALLAQGDPASEGVRTVMVVTPYRAQEALLRDRIGALAMGPSAMEVEVCTLDRCQGREADVVLLSLVRSRATAFLSLPKRWNVALTRAREGLFLVGNLEAYLHAASVGSRELLPQLINRYAQQLGAWRQE